MFSISLFFKNTLRPFCLIILNTKKILKCYLPILQIYGSNRLITPPQLSIFIFTGSPRNETNPFCLSNIDVSNFLNLHSKENHQHFCLAYVFTYRYIWTHFNSQIKYDWLIDWLTYLLFRDFTGGTLGLAWVASASGASGGICEKYKTYAENINGIHHKAKRSLNTGKVFKVLFANFLAMLGAIDLINFICLLAF